MTPRENSAPEKLTGEIATLIAKEVEEDLTSSDSAVTGTVPSVSAAVPPNPAPPKDIPPAPPVAARQEQQRTGSEPADRAIAESPQEVAAQLPRPQSRAPAIRSLSNSIHDIANTVLYGAGFTERQIEASDVVEILRFLEDCREEGRALYPEILLTTNLPECLEGLHPLKLILSGECSDRPGRFRRALKKCAAIAAEPWVVAIEVSPEKVKYGFASSEVRADSASLYSSLIETHAVSIRPPFLFIRRFGTRAVWLRSPKEEHVVSLTLSEELLKANEHTETFAKLIVEDVGSDVQEKTFRVITRLIQEACREGHGFISCVVKADENTVHACQQALTDGSWLSVPLSLTSFTLDGANAAAALESDSAIRANASLARQMVQMDLMTMFTTAGTIIGYNIHIPPARGTKTMTGGARTRAFAALAEIPSLRGAFMCSQDGLTSFTDFSHASNK